MSESFINMRRVFIFVATWLALCGSVVVAQQIILPGFPPGTFSNKAALDPGGAPPAYTGPLDVIASPVVWYGLQCAATAYTGNMADIWDAATGSTTETLLTCSSGGVINQTINSLSVTCAVSCNIKTLYDQSGASSCSGACDLTQVTNASRPLLNQSVLTGKLVANCTGSSTMLSPSLTSQTAQPNTWSAVSERTSGSNYPTILAVTSPLAGIFYDVSADIIAMYNGGTVLIASATDGAFHAAQFLMSGGTGTFYVDGSTTGPEGGLTSTNLSANTLALCSTATQTLTGYIGETGFWAADETAYFSAINSNQHSRWGF